MDKNENINVTIVEDENDHISTLEEFVVEDERSVQEEALIFSTSSSSNNNNNNNNVSVSNINNNNSNSDHQYSMNVSDYQLGAVIGFGSSAIVYMANYSPLSTDVAIKMIELDHFERNRIDELRKEIQVMAFCKHPNLLGILTSFVHESKLWIVTPYLSGGSCLDIMKSGFRDGLDEAVIAIILIQALQGLEYLHENGHIHRDVKCGNLLMAEDGLVQLADFGVSSSLMEDGERHGVRKTYVGTPCWMAPEVMEITRGYDFKADIWSFGITALELAYGHAPYAKFPPMKVIYLTLSGKPPTLDKKQATRKYSRIFKDMIDCCLQRDPAKRPSAKILLKHPFFKSCSKKYQILVNDVISHVPPVNLRDKSAQLRARGLPVPLPAEEANNGLEAADETEIATLTADEQDNLDTSESWDFSLDNSNENDVNILMPASNFDVIAEEEEEDADEEYDDDNKSIEQPQELSDHLPEARIIEYVGTNLNEFQKNRTSRFILAAEEDLKEAMDRLDLTQVVVLLNEQDGDEIVGSVNEFNSSNSASKSSLTSTTSSSDNQLLSNSIYNARSASPNESNENPTEVKKGRFSVLEAVNTSDEDPNPDGETVESGTALLLAPVVSPLSSNVTGSSISANNNSTLMAPEEEKRSRFEVSQNVPVVDVSDSEDPESVDDVEAQQQQQQQEQQYDNLTLTQATNFDPNQIIQNPMYSGAIYHNSAQMISGSPYSTHQNYPLNTGPQSTAGYSFYPSSLAQSGMFHPQINSFHRSSLTGGISVYPLHSPHPTGPVPMSPVNPVQLEHLLHVNDCIRNQLVELKYRHEIMNIQQQQQQQQQHIYPHPHHQHPQYHAPVPTSNSTAQVMRPHSTFNPHNYISTSEIHPHPHQFHHSHPVMPPPLSSNDQLPTGYSDASNSCYCCPVPINNNNNNNNINNNNINNNNSSSISQSMSPVDLTGTINSNSPNNSNISFILKELDTIKRENEILKQFLQQQHHQQQQQ